MSRFTKERTAHLIIWRETRAPMFCTMRRTFLSVKVVALRRRVISFRRGWVQLPGLSGMGVAAGRFGVEIMTLVPEVDDITGFFCESDEGREGRVLGGKGGSEGSSDEAAIFCLREECQSVRSALF